MVKIVGILNVNKDSFYDGGRYIDVNKAFLKAKQMIADGADIIEIGGFSTKPGSIVPSIEVELNRVLPVLKKINTLDIPISIDTTRHQIVRIVKCFCNVLYINDTSGLQDEKILDEIVGTHITYILMHMYGSYETMNEDVQYQKGFINEIHEFFETKIHVLKVKGISNIIIDPGFSFNKTPSHNIELIQKLDTLKKIGYPIFVALSRKSHILSIHESGDNRALYETCILNFLCLTKGASYIRVHDIKEAKHVIELFRFFTNLGFYE